MPPYIQQMLDAIRMTPEMLRMMHQILKFSTGRDPPPCMSVEALSPQPIVIRFCTDPHKAAAGDWAHIVHVVVGMIAEQYR